MGVVKHGGSGNEEGTAAQPKKEQGRQTGVKKEAKVKDAGTEDSSWGQCAWSFRAGV